MISHSYLLLGAAAVWIVTNFLGAAFRSGATICGGRRQKRRLLPTAALPRNIKSDAERYR